MVFEVMFLSIELREKWISIIGHRVSKSSSVCSDHFTDTDFRYKVIQDVPKRYLLPDAVPSLLHPIQQTIILTSSKSLREKNTEQEVDNSDTNDKYPTSEVDSKQSAVSSPAALIETINNSDTNDKYPTSEVDSKQSAVSSPAALIETIISSDINDKYLTSEIDSKQSAVSSPAALINEDSLINKDYVYITIVLLYLTINRYVIHGNTIS
ncbi:uncharacterized protein LOC109860983 isoform X2 [Pseudomyrmex gracilis]|uniref:uncharacterized protein LOC109860983 isoform X2 n=1 Tax=Pseudomyrmex gracilis TaxID=219809 RepID=UPI000995A8D9|nr:uncharacterized protein LOC109860983 isoform X2 [Pseudomyrmex gracilis]